MSLADDALAEEFKLLQLEAEKEQALPAVSTPVKNSGEEMKVPLSATTPKVKVQTPQPAAQGLSVTQVSTTTVVNQRRTVLETN